VNIGRTCPGRSSSCGPISPPGPPTGPSTVNTTERRATALRYREPAGPASARLWVEALLSDEDPVAAVPVPSLSRRRSQPGAAATLVTEFGGDRPRRGRQLQKHRRPDVVPSCAGAGRGSTHTSSTLGCWSEATSRRRSPSSAFARSIPIRLLEGRLADRSPRRGRGTMESFLVAGAAQLQGVRGRTPRAAGAEPEHDQGP
jgi:hypothetical protein